MTTVNTVHQNTSATRRSPFAVFPYEQLVAVKAPILRPAVSAPLSDLDKLILLAVNEMMLATSRLLHQNLCNQGLQNVEIDTLRQRVKFLSETGYLTKLEFRSPAGASLFKVYTLANGGRDFLHQCGQRAAMTGYIAQLDATQAKRILAAQQFVLSQKYNAPVFLARTVCQTARPVGSRDSNIFRTHAIVDLPGRTILVEAVRNHQDSSEELLKKLRRIHSTLALERLNTPIRDDATLVLVCESYDHMLRVMEDVRSLEGRLSFRLQFTNDTDVYNRPDCCLVRNKQEDLPRSRFSALLQSLFQ